MIMAALACSRFKWVVIDLPEEIDGVLDNPAFRKLNCTRSGDVWPYISTFASRFGIPQDCAGELAEYAKANPELPPMELLANFTSLINERTRSLSDMAEKGGPTRRPIPKAVQREVWRRDQGRCVECGSKENLEFDHIIPVSRGGANTTRNIQLMCESCNRRKSNKEPGV
jgi:5-methylcytosine-specific restriction endonuclease McrA